ncbi:MAG: hypothetical protein QE493_01165 [Verrucomicrobiae bacterium]|jgi:hypothetical protein|nr:hypothetical protein [Verrucomicrobiae bacterium]
MNSKTPYPSPFDQLASALRSRLSTIADHELRDRDPATHLKKLQVASEAIDQSIAALLKSEIDPQLRHYLDRRSFDKALEWIESNRASRDISY